VSYRHRGAVFGDPDVARAYRQRSPYGAETFRILEGLLAEPRVVLDLGSGSGSLAREMTRFADRVDAVDPSAAMIQEGRKLPHGSDPKVRWVLGTAEDANLDGPYGLATAGTSVHWFDPARVMPRLVAALAPGARFAIVEIDDGEHPMPGMFEIFDRYSDLHHSDLDDVVRELVADGLFVREGEQRTAPVTIRRTLSEYVEYLHSTSEFAPAQLGARAAAFDSDVRELFAREGMTAIEREYVTVVTWGRPVAP
jgi:SAM-dependent methyltransferase